MRVSYIIISNFVDIWNFSHKKLKVPQKHAIFCCGLLAVILVLLKKSTELNIITRLYVILWFSKINFDIAPPVTFMGPWTRAQVVADIPHV